MPFEHAAPLRKALEHLEAWATNSSPGWKSSSTSSASTIRACARKTPASPASRPTSSPSSPPGYQYLTEQRYDQIDPIVEILRTNLVALGLPLRSFEVEFGPSQVEFTLAPHGPGAADAMVLFRSAVKQIARRHGYHATFMCRPKLPNVMSSGWHLHQSLRKNGRNAFMSDKDDLSETGKHYLAGLLAHARGAAAFSTPTINGYKRYRPTRSRPTASSGARRTAARMLRVVGGRATRDTHREPHRRAGGQSLPLLRLADLRGPGRHRARLPLPPSADTPYEAKAEPLPRTLAEALHAPRATTRSCARLRRTFVDYYCRIKEAEIARFNLEVSDWEHREYFDLF